MSSLTPMLTEYAFAAVLGLFVLFSVIDRTVDVVFAMRLKRRQRVGSQSFPVVARAVLPHEGEGPGVYRIVGVVEQTGTPTNFDVDARCVSDAREKALERGVSPAVITKRPPRHRSAA
jgi:hypothetical protein